MKKNNTYQENKSKDLPFKGKGKFKTYKKYIEVVEDEELQKELDDAILEFDTHDDES